MDADNETLAGASDAFGWPEQERRDLIAGFVAAAVALVVFGWLATQVFGHEVIRFDAAIRDGGHPYASPGLPRCFRVGTEFGAEKFLIPFGAFALGRRLAAGRRQAAVL